MPTTPAPAPPVRRHTPLAARPPAPRALARVTDAAGWTARKPIGFNAAI